MPKPFAVAVKGSPVAGRQQDITLLKVQMWEVCVESHVGYIPEGSDVSVLTYGMPHWLHCYLYAC